jgi:hypothetical protein
MPAAACSADFRQEAAPFIGWGLAKRSENPGVGGAIPPLGTKITQSFQRINRIIGLPLQVRNWDWSNIGLTTTACEVTRLALEGYQSGPRSSALAALIDEQLTGRLRA